MYSLLVAGCLTLLADVPPERPSAAVFALDLEEGVAPGAGTPITEELIRLFTQSGLFARVAGAAEIESVLSAERQRLLLECNNPGCVVEIASVLGLDYVVAGRLGKLGESQVLTVRLINARDGNEAASFSETLPGGADEALQPLPAAVTRLLTDGGLLAPPPAPAEATPTLPEPAAPVTTDVPPPEVPEQLPEPAPAEVAEPSPPVADSAPSPVVTPPSQVSPLTPRRLAMAGGTAALALGGAAVATSVLGALLAGGMALLKVTSGTNGAGQVMAATYYAGLGGAALFLSVALVLAAAGVGAWLVGLVVR